MARKVTPVRERFESKWAPMPNGCWCWMDVLAGNGYGYLGVGGRAGRKIQAHRLAYEFYVGPIPEGLQIDHLCRNRWCVNWRHLRAVTQRVNLLRGSGASARNAAKTECVRGHPLSGPESDVTMDARGRRTCQRCYKDRLASLRLRTLERRVLCHSSWTIQRQCQSLAL